MAVDLSFLKTQLIGKTVDKPISGTLSGHSAGEPFDKAVEELLKDNFKNSQDIYIYRQYEYLNTLYQQNLDKTTIEERYNLIESKPLQYLLNRGRDTTKKWTEENIFEEKQNDTADILIKNNSFTHILDVKTRNLSKNAQAPNIISALKLAEMCKVAVENEEFDNFDIQYIGIDWKLDSDKLVCKSSYVKNLFKTNPSCLYINWAAALQIQFHVDELQQDYDKDFKNWCFDYLEHFIKGAKKRINYMENNWINKYKGLLDK